MQSLIFIIVLSIISLWQSGCGKYIPAVSPDVLVPTAVLDLKSSLFCVPPEALNDPLANPLKRPVCQESNLNDENRVVISWIAPEKDLRGRELKDLTGYRIEQYVVEVDPNQPLTDSPNKLEYTEVGFIEDTFLSILFAKRKEAEARGDITRRVKVKTEERTFTFIEPQPTTGTVYYRIIPVNYEGGDGPASSLVQVTDGPNDKRVISILPNQ